MQKILKFWVRILTEISATIEQFSKNINTFVGLYNFNETVPRRYAVCWGYQRSNYTSALPGEGRTRTLLQLPHCPCQVVFTLLFRN